MRRIVAAAVTGSILTICLALGAVAAQATPAGAITTAPGCSTAVAVAPALSNVETGSVTQALEPFGVAISANNKTAFVADASGAILVYTLGSASLKLDDLRSFHPNQQDQPAPPLGRLSPSGVALTPNGRDLIAAAGSGAVVFSVTGLEKRSSPISAWTVGTLRSSGSGAIETAVSPDGNYVFVTLESSDVLAVFDLRRALHQGFSHSVPVGMVPLGIAPVGIAVAPNGRYLYVTSEATTSNQNEGTLTTIDMAKAEHDPSRAIVSTVSAGCSPVRVTATSTSVFVTARGSDSVLAFDARDLVLHPGSSLKAEVRVGEAPVGLALVDHGHLLVVADSNRFSAPGAGASLAVVNVSVSGQMSLAGYVGTGVFPRDMAVSHDGKTLLVSDFGGQLESVNVSTLP
jgi:DNA-binding beta-propeller fold protein YncE